MKRILITLSICLLANASFAQKNKAKDFVLGQTVQMHSDILKENRTLNIYLPQGYSADKQYPVVYLLDGGANEDFIHVVGLVQFNTFEWIKAMPKSIVVGIANTDRERDFTFPSVVPRDKQMMPTAGGSSAFMAFLSKELKPYIYEHYAADTTQSTLIGQSLGGLMATQVLLSHPNWFNKYIIVSPSLWWNDASLLKMPPNALNKDYTGPTRVYIGVGKEGSLDGSGNHVMEEEAKQLAELVQEHASKSVEVYYDFMPAENHATSLHPAVFNAIRWLYKK